MKPKRRCGTCTACCKELGVPTLHKPSGTACEKLDATTRCSIYETRPPECRSFECLWLQGIFDGADRPDRLGVIASPTISEDFATYKHGQALVLREAFPGGFDKAARLIQSCAEHMVVILVNADRTRRLLGPSDQVAWARAAMAARFLPVVKGEGEA
jgi:hypothetical protein